MRATFWLSLVVFIVACERDHPLKLDDSPPDAKAKRQEEVASGPELLHVRVRARQWSWQFYYDADSGEGWMSPNLVVARGQKVTLTLTSEDVVHTLYIPALRIKQDAIPGRVATLTFVAPESKPSSELELVCAEYCGRDHATMTATLDVLSPDGFAAWLAEQRSHARK